VVTEVPLVGVGVVVAWVVVVVEEPPFVAVGVVAIWVGAGDEGVGAVVVEGLPLVAARIVVVWAEAIVFHSWPKRASNLTV
jgi:hypothetical protein